MRRGRSSGRDRRSGNRLLLVPVTGILIGIVIISYPLFSHLYYRHLNEIAISSMTSSYDRYDPDSPEIYEIRTQAEKYNARLSGTGLDTEVIWPYDEQLDLEGTDVMAYVEIPAINVKMPVYHGTGEETLSAGAGHLEGTSLPVGGKSTHCVLTAHSGMKNMEAFDRLGLLKKGDLVAVTTLGETLVYAVEDSETVLPYETESLNIVPDRDFLTLITCTPYGINDHRLLVHCSRTYKELSAGAAKKYQDEPEDAPDSYSVNGYTDNLKEFLFRNMRVIPAILAGCIILIILISATVRNINRKKRRKRKRYRRNPHAYRPDNAIIRPGERRWN